MKVLIVSQYYPPEPFRVGDLASGLVEHGCEVTVLTGFPNYPKGKLYEGYRIRPYYIEHRDGVKIVRVPLFPDTSYSAFRRIANYLSYMFSASLLGPILIRPESYDAIITWQLSPVTIGVPSVVIKTLHFSKAPILFCVQDIWPESLEATGLAKNKTILGLIHRLVGFLYRRSAMVLVQSRGMIPKVLEHGIPPERLGYLPNWAEDLYRPVPYDAELAEREGMKGRFNVVFGGNVGSAQNLEQVLGAAKMLQDYPDIQFVIFGDGASRAALEKAARDLPNVVFRGYRPAELMPKLYAIAGAVLVSLRKDPLFAITVPSKVQSYLASARPIIAALEGSGAEIVIEAEAGVACSPENPEALRDAVLMLYHMTPEERRQLGENGRRYYEEQFARPRILERLVTFMHGKVTQ